MACGCGRRAGSTLTASGGGVKSYKYEVTYPNGDTDVFLTPLEAKREVRKAGGGTIKRIAEQAPATT